MGESRNRLKAGARALSEWVMGAAAVTLLFAWIIFLLTRGFEWALSAFVWCMEAVSSLAEKIDLGFGHDILLLILAAILALIGYLLNRLSR